MNKYAQEDTHSFAEFVDLLTTDEFKCAKCMEMLKYETGPFVPIKRGF